MELKTLDDPDKRNVALAALDAYRKCLPASEYNLKIWVSEVYGEIQVRVAEKKYPSHDCEGF